MAEECTQSKAICRGSHLTPRNPQNPWNPRNPTPPNRCRRGVANRIYQLHSWRFISHSHCQRQTAEIATKHWQICDGRWFSGSVAHWLRGWWLRGWSKGWVGVMWGIKLSAMPGTHILYRPQSGPNINLGRATNWVESSWRSCCFSRCGFIYLYTYI